VPLPYVEESPLAFGGHRPRRDATRYSIVGVPFDSTASYRGGQRWGPASIRRASAFIEFRSLHAGVDAESIPIYDEGDVAIINGDVKGTLLRASHAIRELVSEGRIPIVLGGEHTVTYGVVDALRESLGSPPCIVVFDAHFDLRDEYMGNKFSHACVMRRILERLHPPVMFYIGVRGFSDEEARLADERPDISYATSLDVERLGEANIAARVRRALSGCEHVYLSIDMDFLDPAYAPGVGNPEPGGLTVREALNLLHSIVDERLTGFDVVEVAPPYDPGEITAITATKLVVEVVAAREASGRSRGPRAM